MRGSDVSIVNPPCPACGAPTIRKSGMAGPFLGCTTWPKCRHTTDLDAPNNEHPIVRTRRLALKLVRRKGRQWSDDEQHDAVGDALVRAIASGWADQPAAWLYVTKNALRSLRGWQWAKDRQGRRRRVACRSPLGSRSTAGPALTRPLVGPVSPSEWIEAEVSEPAEQDTFLLAGEQVSRGLMSGGAAIDALRGRGWQNTDLEQLFGLKPKTGRKWGADKGEPRWTIGARLIDLALSNARPTRAKRKPKPYPSPFWTRCLAPYVGCEGTGDVSCFATRTDILFQEVKSGRRSFRSAAGELGVSDKTLKRRIEMMRDQNP